MLAIFIKNNIVSIAIIATLLQIIIQLKLDNISLQADVAFRDKTIAEQNLKITVLESSNTVLETAIGTNNQRIDQQNKLQQELAQKGQQAAALAAKNTQELGEQIKLLKGKLPQGATECERVFSLLQDL